MKNPCDDLAEYMKQHGKRKELCDERRYARIKGTAIIIGIAIVATFIIASLI
jgi:hypothetical protein